METSRVDRLSIEMNQLSYKEKLLLYKKVFSIGNFGDDLNETLILISLVALTTTKMREKNPEVTPLKVLMQITSTYDQTTGFFQLLENISILVDDMIHVSPKIDNCGLKTSAEIINRIKNILNQWLPF